MASFWQQMPFIRIIIPFILGIILADQTPPNVINYSILLALSGILLFIKIKFYPPEFLKGMWFNSMFFLLGITSIYLNNYTQLYHHFSKQQNTILCIQITEKPQKTAKGFKAEATVLYGIDSLNKQNKLNGKLLLYFKNLGNYEIPHYGDQLFIKSGFHEFSLPKNPGAFNYKIYMSRKGFFHQIFLGETEYLISGVNKGNLIYKKVLAFQEFIKEVLKSNLTNLEEIAIAEALLYGYDKDISDEITAAYSRTGTLHVLAVSGMHVGLIFMLLSLFLKPFEKNKKGKFWVAIINLIGIWTYSLICGFTPSILRATVMFTFIIIGKLIQRGGNPFNSLAASAMLLLIINPQLIYNVGFQLSYSAVLGILGFYQQLYLVYTFKYRWMDEIWKIFSVSIAAQILTLPLSIFYFHQIPNYFLIANLAIIPISTLIIYAGIILLIISPFPYLPLYLGKAIAFLIQLLNNIALWIAALPGSYIDQLNWNGYTLIFTYIFILCCIVYISLRDLLFLRLALCMLLALQINKAHQGMLWNQQNKLVIYQLKEGLGMEIIQHKKALVYTNFKEPNESTIYKQVIIPNHYKNGIEKSLFKEIDSCNLYLEINKNFKVYLVQTDSLPQHEKIDIVIISGNKYVDIANLINHNKIKKVVLNQDLKASKRAAIKKILTSRQIPFHDIKESGAFELSL